MAAGKAGLRETLAEHVRAERTPRELRLVRLQPEGSTAELPEYELPIPGEVTAEAFGFRLIAQVKENPVLTSAAKLRTHKAGDRVRLRYSSGPKRIKDVLERLKVPPDQRKKWPVLEWQGEIVWIRNTAVESSAGATAGLEVHIEELP